MSVVLQDAATRERIAAKFSEILELWLTADEMATVRERNATDVYALCCASHDFCDANMAMAEAFESIGIDPLGDGDDDSEGMDSDVVDAWNAAWDIAKVRYLTKVAP